MPLKQERRRPVARCAVPPIETFETIEPIVRNISHPFSSSERNIFFTERPLSNVPPSPQIEQQNTASVVAEHDKPNQNNETNNISKIPMSTIIKKKSDWASKELNVIRAIYHYINTKYWILSIIVIILSSILTIIESIKLIFIDTGTKYLESDTTETYSNDNRILYIIGKNSLNWNLVCDILSLLTGVAITLIMSLIRFNKYQINLEFISNRLMQLTTYKSNIILMQYKVDNTNYDIKHIKAEFFKMEENIYKDSELDKIISDNKEEEFRREVEKLHHKGHYRYYLLHILSKYLCCRFRISNLKKCDNATTKTEISEPQTTEQVETNKIKMKIDEYV